MFFLLSLKIGVCYFLILLYFFTAISESPILRIFSSIFHLQNPALFYLFTRFSHIIIPYYIHYYTLLNSLLYIIIFSIVHYYTLLFSFFALLYIITLIIYTIKFRIDLKNVVIYTQHLVNSKHDEEIVNVFQIRTVPSTFFLFELEESSRLSISYGRGR